MNEMSGTFQLKGVGRNKVTKTVTVENNDQFFSAIKSCGVMSNDIEFEYDMEQNKGKIFVGGFRMIGEFEEVAVENAIAIN